MREINVYINGDAVISSSDIAGVQGSGKGSFLKFRFAENWHGLTKRVIFTNAKGLNPVVIILGVTELLEEDNGKLLNYGINVPPEALEFPGEICFLAEGTTADGKPLFSAREKMSVIFGVSAAMRALVGATDVSPSQAAQLQAQLDNLYINSIKEITREKDTVTVTYINGETDTFELKDGNGIASIVMNDDYTLTFTFDNGTSYTTKSIRGEPGKDYVLTEADKDEIAEKSTEELAEVKALALEEIENVGNAKIDEVQKKGAETLNSIPDDYRELSENVDQLSEEIVDNYKLGVRLTAGTDLDTLTDPGVYYCDAFAIGKTLLNCPDSNAFKMVVDNRYKSNSQQQIFYGYTSGMFYRRVMGSSGWSVWRKFATEQELLDEINSLTEVVKDNYKIGTRLTSGMDLDTLTEPGVYYCDAFAIGKTLLNCPDSNAFKMVVDNLFTSNSQQQIIYGTLSGNIYRRTKTSTGWRAWANILSKGVSLDHASRKAYALNKKLNVDFTPLATIPASYLGSQEEQFFHEGQTYEGIPYSSVNLYERDCFYNFTPETLFSMLKNPDSKMYDYESDRTGAKTYTGAVCSSYVSWFANCDIYYTTYDIIAMMDVKRFVDIEDLEVGDIIYEPGHVKVVAGFSGTNAGELSVIVSEMVTPTFRVKEYTRASFIDYVNTYEPTIGRLPKQGLPRTMKELVIVDDCISERGDNTYYELGEDVWMMVNGKTLSVLPPNSDTWITVDKSSLPTKNGRTTQYNLKTVLNKVGVWKLKTELSDGKESKIAIYTPATVYLDDERVTVVGHEGCKVHSYQVHYIFWNADAGHYSNMRMTYDPDVSPQYKGTMSETEFTINATKIKDRYSGYFVRVYFDTGCGRAYADSNEVFVNNNS